MRNFAFYGERKQAKQHKFITAGLRLVNSHKRKQMHERLDLFNIQLFRERLLEKVHATIPTGMVGGLCSLKFFEEI